MARPRPPILEHPGPRRAIIEPADLYSRHKRIPGRVVLCFFHEVLDAISNARSDIAGLDDKIVCIPS